MNYTTLERVKSALNTALSSGDLDLTAIIIEASRAIDRYCTGSMTPESIDYFLLENKTNEILPSTNGVVAADGRLLCYPRKPLVTAVSALAWRARPMDAWQDVPTDHIDFADGHTVEVWAGISGPSRVSVKLSYTGGLADKTGELPDDFVNIATVMAVRLYREERTGLTDQIGVAELFTFAYTKAMPQRVVKMLEPYKRNLPW